MSSDWHKKKVRELGRVITGKTPPTGDPLNFGGRYPFITIPDLNGRVYIGHTIRTISEKGRGHLRASILPKGAVCMSCIASVGLTGISDRPSFTNQQINSVIPDLAVVSAEYLYYSFRVLSKELKSADGTVFTNISKSKFGEYEITVPPLAYQDRVVAILLSIDEAINNLQHQNTSLEAIAQRLFRSWFVNFDPVHAKAAGQEPEAMSAELAALFPSEFEDSELGKIPKGWSASSLGAVCCLNSESWSAKNHPNNLKYIDLSGLKKNILSKPIEYQFSEAPSRARRVLRKGDSLYGTVRPGNLSYGFIGKNEPGLTGSTGFAVLRPTETYSAEFVYCAMTLKENISRLTHLAEGAAYPAVRPDIVHEQALVLPCTFALKAFHSATQPLFEMQSNNSSVTAGLESLRDHLLPRLISGKLSLEDAEASVAEIASGYKKEPA